MFAAVNIVDSEVQILILLPIVIFLEFNLLFTKVSPSLSQLEFLNIGLKHLLSFVHALFHFNLHFIHGLQYFFFELFVFFKHSLNRAGVRRSDYIGYILLSLKMNRGSRIAVKLLWIINLLFHFQVREIWISIWIQVFYRDILRMTVFASKVSLDSRGRSTVFIGSVSIWILTESVVKLFIGAIILSSSSNCWFRSCCFTLWVVYGVYHI